MLHMLSYDHQGGGVGGWGACINVLDEHFLYVTEDAQRCTCCRMIIRGVGCGGWGACINVLDEHFLYITEDAHVAHAVV